MHGRPRAQVSSKRSLRAWIYAGAAVLVACGCSDPGGGGSANVAPGEAPSGFAAAGACAQCHPTEHSLWAGSHHDQAIQPASSETVLGDFDEAEFEQFGVATRFHRSQDRYRVETQGPDGQVGDFEVVYTFGVEPLQQYLVQLPGGRLQALTIAWDTERKTWFSLYPDEPIAPGDPLHWTGRRQRWNSMCADCHTTAFQRGYDLESDAYRASWAEIDVGCQACHGPAADHVAWAREPDHQGDPGLPVQFASGTAREQVEVCAPCHSRRHKVSDQIGIGEPYLDHYMPALLHPALYYPDGQVLDEVYVYGSFVQSRMYRNGVRCSDCHEPHGLTLRAEGNALCTRCHSEQPDPRFPSLAARAYDSPQHHFHSDGSPGASCVECHMPAKLFMQVDSRRDHSLRIPRPDLSLKLGTPNACTGCHTDRDAEWAALELAARRPAGAPPREHYGEALAAGWTGAPGAAERVAALALDAELPAIVRATATVLLPTLRQAAVDPLPTLIAASVDVDPLVRASAARALELRPSPQGVSVLTALLSDSRRAVRIEAARVLGGLPLENLAAEQREALGRGLEEFRAAQRAVSDTPAAHLNLGVLHTQRGRLEQAEQAYQTALRQAPDFVPARVNLANLYNGLRRNDEAERELRAALTSTDQYLGGPEGAQQRGELHYSLGLLLAEIGRLAEAEQELALAAAELPNRPRIRYNRALALQRLGRTPEAEQVFLEAESLAPESPEVQNALAILHLQAARPERALPYAERFVELTGTDAATQLLERVRRRLAGGEPGPAKSEAP
jgi:predicted CXXCH cytochrome family protein